MKRWRTAAASLGLALTTTLAISATSGAAEQAAHECKITAQPWMGHYNLSIEMRDGSVRKLIDAEQHHRFETPPESFTVKAGEVAYVLWAQTKYPATGHDSWGDVLKVHPSECRWADGVHYGAEEGKRDSVIIEDVEDEQPPATSAPSTTVAPPVTTEPPVSSTVPTSTVPPATTEPESELPPATTQPEPPSADGHDDEVPPDTPIQVVAPPTPFPFEPPVTNVPPEAGREPLPEPTTTTTGLTSLPVTGVAWLESVIKVGIILLGGGLAFVVMCGGRIKGLRCADRAQG